MHRGKEYCVCWVRCLCLYSGRTKSTLGTLDEWKFVLVFTVELFTRYFLLNRRNILIKKATGSCQNWPTKIVLQKLRSKNLK